MAPTLRKRNKTDVMCTLILINVYNPYFINLLVSVENKNYNKIKIFHCFERNLDLDSESNS